MQRGRHRASRAWRQDPKIERRLQRRLNLFGDKLALELQLGAVLAGRRGVLGVRSAIRFRADRVHRRYRRCQTSTGSPWHGDHAGRRDAEEDFFVLYVRGHRYEVGSEPVRNIVFRPDPLEAWGSPDPSLAEAQRAAARHDERAGWACREEARRGTEKRGSGSCRAVADGGRGAPRERAARHGVLCPLASPDRTGRVPESPRVRAAQNPHSLKKGSARQGVFVDQGIGNRRRAGQGRRAWVGKGPV